MTAQGDSGSLVVDEERNEAVGLMFAGDEDASYANYLPGYSRFLTRGSMDLGSAETVMSFSYEPSMRKVKTPINSNHIKSSDLHLEKDGAVPSIGGNNFPRELLDPKRRIRYIPITQHHRIEVIDVRGNWVKARIFIFQKASSPGLRGYWRLAAAEPSFFNVNAPSYLYHPA